jgi:Zn-dependent protease with chaperone function
MIVTWGGLCRMILDSSGQVYVFQGLIAKAENANEVAGVIAHEIGHVAHRDGTNAVPEGGSLSFLFGMLLGDSSAAARLYSPRKPCCNPPIRAKRKGRRRRH